MQILMKLKSTNPLPSSISSLSTVKTNDHQKPFKLTKFKQTHPASTNHQTMSIAATTIIQRSHPPPPSADCLDCCSAAAVSSECTKLCYDSATGYCVGGMENSCTPACCRTTTHATAQSQPYQQQFSYAGQDNASCGYEEPEEEDFVSIDDAKIKGFLMNIGKQNKQSANFDINKYRAEAENSGNERQGVEKLNLERTEEGTPKTIPLVYEIIELDDEQEQQRLQSFKNEAIDKARVQLEQWNSALTVTPVRRYQKSPDISLIPKPSEPAAPKRKSNSAAEHRIVAEIELLDSSDEEEFDQQAAEQLNSFEGDDEEEEEDFPLAAAAVSCELDCDDDEDEVRCINAANCEDEEQEQLDPDGNSEGNGNDQPLTIDEPMYIQSDDEFINEHEEGVELQWEDISETNRGGRGEKDSVHECTECGKVVQSSYNLRRHMMIHTGERPFGCDMCERRFREFSDLKKHRRRHVNELNFTCMVCRLNKPTPSDPTRCYVCEYKQIPPKFFSDQARAEAALAQVNIEGIFMPPSKPKVEVSMPPALLKRPSPSQSTPPLRYRVPLKTSLVRVATTLTPPPLKKAATPPLPPLTPIVNLKISIPATSKPSQDSQDGWLRQLSAIQRAQNNNNINDQIADSTSNGSSSKDRPVKNAFECPMCDRSFGTRHNLKRHFMIHTGEKPFSCPTCRKPFREYSTLKKHMVTHLRDRWYKCNHCTMSYRDYMEYLQHKQTHEADDDSSSMDVEPIAKSSGKSKSNQSNASSNNSLTNSPQKQKGEFLKSIASGVYKTQQLMSFEVYDSNDEEDEEDWLECCECQQRFTEIDAYTEHLKEHDLERQVYECCNCKEHFQTRDGLVEHFPQCKEQQSILDDNDDDSGMNKSQSNNAEQMLHGKVEVIVDSDEEDGELEEGDEDAGNIVCGL